MKHTKTNDCFILGNFSVCAKRKISRFFSMGESINSIDFLSKFPVQALGTIGPELTSQPPCAQTPLTVP